MISLYVRVETIFDRYPVQYLGDTLATWEGTERVHPKGIPAKTAKKAGDRFAALNPDGATTVTIALEEKLNGPPNSYSSIAVRVEISSRCDQTDDAVQVAKNLLFKEAHSALEHYMQPAMQTLMAHIQREHDVP